MSTCVVVSGHSLTCIICRICPGKYFAEASLFISIAMILHAFDIGPQLDESGNAILTEPKMTNGIVS